MANAWQRFKEFLGLGDDTPEPYEESDYSTLYQQENTPEARPRTETSSRRERLNQNQTATTQEDGTPRPRTGNVIGMNAPQAEVIVLEPQSFEEAPQLIQFLRERKSVILNLTLMDAEQGQRTVDFVAGATYAIDGRQERLGDGIFLFTPSSVLITTGSLAKATKPATDASLEGFKFGGDFWRSGT